MGEKIARHYDESKNPTGGFFPGVPLRDLTQDEYDALPDWLQKSVDAHDMYRKTPVSGAQKDKETTPTTTKESSKKDGSD